MHLPKGVQKPSPTQIVLTACLLLPSGAFGQSFLFGAKFGIDHSRRPLIGASGERKLWRSFAIGADFLYDPGGFPTSSRLPVRNCLLTPTSAHATLLLAAASELHDTRTSANAHHDSHQVLRKLQMRGPLFHLPQPRRKPRSGPPPQDATPRTTPTPPNLRATRSPAPRPRQPHSPSRPARRLMAPASTVPCPNSSMV